MRRITQAEWRAIHEALAFRLADEIEDVDIPLAAYRSAMEKVEERTP